MPRIILDAGEVPVLSSGDAVTPGADCLAHEEFVVRHQACLALLLVFMSLLLAAAVPCWAAQAINTVDVTTADPATVLTVCSLQGLVNRDADKADASASAEASADKPAIYLLRNPEDAYWLAEFALSSPASKPQPLSAQDFIAQFKGRAAGQILYDPAKPYTAQIALSAAGALDAVVTATDLGLKTILDTRTTEWKTPEDAYRWAIGNLLHRCSRDKIGVLDPQGDGPLDYFVKERVFVLGLDPAQEEGRRLIEQTFGRMPPGIVVIGPPALQQDPWARLIQQWGHSLLPCSPVANLSFDSASPPAVPLRQLKHYVEPSDKPLVAFAYLPRTDSVRGLGNCDLAYALRGMAALWAAAGRGSVPLGWMVQPALLDFAPAALQRYYAEAALSGVDEFIMAPNGADALSLTGNRYLAESLGRVRDYAERGGLEAMAVSTPGASAEVAAALQRLVLEGGVRGMLLLQGTSAPAGLYANTPALAETVRATTPFETLKAIRDAAKHGKYIFVAVPPEAMSPAEIAIIAAHLGDDVRVMGPLELLDAAREGAVRAAAKPPEKPGFEVTEVTLSPAEQIRPADQVAVTARVTTGARVAAARLIYTLGESPVRWTERMRSLADGSFVGLLPPMLNGGRVQVRVQAVGADGIALSKPVLFEVRAPDSDDDGLADAAEAFFRSDPHNRDTDGDGLLDGNDPDPLRITAAPGTYLAPIVPPGDGHVLAENRASSLVEGGRKVTGTAQFTYRLPLEGVPEGTSAMLKVLASGPAALSVSTDGQKFSPAVSGTAAEGPQALQWAIPPEALTAGTLYLRFAAADGKEATLHSVGIGSGPEAPSIVVRGLRPAPAAPGLRSAAMAQAYDPDGLASVDLLYRVSTGPIVTRRMEEYGHSQVYGAALPDLASGNVISIQVKATDKKGHSAVSPAMAFPVGLTRAETISLTAVRDFEGDLRPWPAAGMDWHWGTAAQADRAKAAVLGGRYLVWLLAAPRGLGLHVEVDGKRVGEIKPDAPGAWQRVGTVDLAAGQHQFGVVCDGGPKDAIRGYAQMLISTDGSAAPRGALVTDYLNTISLLSPEPDATVSKRVTIRATATGNVVRADCYVDKELIGRQRVAPYEFHWDTREFRPGEHTIELRAINGADEAMLSAQITVTVTR